MEKKITNKEMYTIVRSIVEAVGIPEEVETSVTPDDIISWTELKIEQLSRKATTPTKAQKEKQEANAVLAEQIFNTLVAARESCEEEEFKGMTLSDIIKTGGIFDGITTQKLSPIMKKLAADGRVEKIVDKKKSKYRAVV